MALSEASADIVLDFKNFEPQLRRQLNRVIVLAANRGRAAGNAFGRAFVAAARPHLEGVFRRTRLTQQAAAIGRQAGADFSSALRDGVRSIDIDLTSTGRRAGETLRRGLDEAASRSTLPRTLQAISSALGALGRGVRIAGITAGIALLGGVAAATAVSVIKLGLSISQLGPALAAVGSLASTAATQLAILGSAAIVGTALALTTLRLALSDVGDALKAALSGDAAKFTKALEGLAPSARRFVKVIGEAKFGLDELRLSVQQATFEPLRNSAAQIVAVLPAVSRILSAIGRELGVLGAEFIRVATSAGVLGSVSTVATNLGAALRRLLPAVAPLVRAFARLAAFGSSAFVPLADVVVRAARAFERWVTVGIESGRFADQLSRTLEGLREVFRALAAFGQDIATIFVSIGAAARAAGIEAGNLFSGIGQLVSIVADFVSSAEGMNVLTSVFRSLNTITQALQPAIVAVLRGLEPLGRILADLAVGLGPGLTAGIEGLVDGLRALIPAALPVGEAIGGMLQEIGIALRTAGQVLAPFLQAVAAGLTVGLKAAIPILDAFSRAIGLVAGVVSDFFGSPEVQAIIARTGEVFARFGTMVGEAIARVAPALARLVETFLTGLLPVWDQLNATLLDSGLVEVLGQLAQAFGTVLATSLDQLSDQLVVLMPQLATLAIELGKGLGDALAIVIPMLPQLIGSMVRLFTTVAPLLPQLLKLSSEFLKLAVDSGALRAVLVLVVGMLKLLAAVMATGVGAVTIFVNTLSAMVNVFGRILRAISPVLDALRTFLRLAAQASSFTFNLPNLPGFARGTFIPPGSDPIVAQLHPNEVVIPLSDPRRAAQLAQQSGLMDLLSGALSGGSGLQSGGAGVLIGPGAVQVNIQGDVTSSQARAIGVNVGEGLASVLSRRTISTAIRRI